MPARIVFEFDDEATAQLIGLMDRHNFQTMGKTISYCLGLTTSIGKHADEGFTELIVRNPNTSEQRKLILPPK